MRHVIVGVLTRVGAIIFMFAVLYFVIKYAVKSAIKDILNALKILHRGIVRIQ